MSDISPTLSNEIRSDDYYVIVGHNRGINQLQTKVINLNYLENPFDNSPTLSDHPCRTT